MASLVQLIDRGVSEHFNLYPITADVESIDRLKIHALLLHHIW